MELEIVRHVLPEATRPHIRRFADYLGLIAFYPFLLIIGDIMGDFFLLSIAEMYFLLLLLGFSFVFLKLGKILKHSKFSIASAVILLIFAVDLISIVYQVATNTILPEIIPTATKLIPIVIIGLTLHDLSKLSSVLKKLDKMGGITIIGSFLLVIKFEVTIMLGILFLAIGFASASQFVRKIAYSTLIGEKEKE